MSLPHSFLPKPLLMLIVMAICVIIVAGVKASSALWVPLLLSLFIAMPCAPLVLWLTRYNIPPLLSVAFIISVFIVGLLIVATLVSGNAAAFYQDLPMYKAKLAVLFEQLIHLLSLWGVHLEWTLVSEYFDPGAAFSLVAGMLSELRSLLTNAFLIIFTVVFILLEVKSLPYKLSQAFGDNTATVTYFYRFNQSVQKYLMIKLLISLLTGVVAGLWLAFLGLDNPFLWALLAFLLNFIPNIGSIIAAIPPTLLALVQLGWFSALAVAVGYLCINLLLGNIIEQRMMGRTLGLSTLVVFLSLIFWGWVLGPVGMLLSVPLTMVIKLALDQSEQFAWLGVLLDE